MTPLIEIRLFWCRRNLIFPCRCVCNKSQRSTFCLCFAESLWNESRRTGSSSDIRSGETSSTTCPSRPADGSLPRSRSAFGPHGAARPTPAATSAADAALLHFRRYPPSCHQLRPPTGSSRYPANKGPLVQAAAAHKEPLVKLHQPVSQCGARPNPAGAPASRSDHYETPHSGPNTLPNGHHPANNNELAKYGRQNGDGGVSQPAPGDKGSGPTGMRTFSDSKLSPQQSPSRPSAPSCNTFGHTGPLRPLGKVDEARDEISDDSTTTSGSFELHGDASSPHPTVRTKMDTVV